MRWFWIDRFTEFVSGEYAVATKSVSLGEDYLHGYYHTHPMLPNALVVEGLAQAAGLLMGEATQYKSRLVLAKISKVEFHFAARPGDTLTYRSTIEHRRDEGVLFHGISKIGDRLQAETEFYLAILQEKQGGRELFIPADFVRLLRILRIYEVGRTPDGRPLQMPDHLVQMERAGTLSAPVT